MVDEGRLLTRGRGPAGIVAIALAIIMLGSRSALACSGPGVLFAIARAERLVLVLACGSALGAAAVLWRLRKTTWRKGRVGVLCLAAAHPGWWMSARHGDCGSLVVGTSYLCTAVLAIWCGWMLFRATGRLQEVAILGGCVAALLTVATMAPVDRPPTHSAMFIEGVAAARRVELQRCPTLNDVFGEDVASTAKSRDQWGTPFSIVCSDRTITIVSAGPDTRLGTEDDISTPGI